MRSPRVGWVLGHRQRRGANTQTTRGKHVDQLGKRDTWCDKITT